MVTEDDVRRIALSLSPLSSMPVEYLTQAIEGRAMDVLTLLADRSQHRAVHT